MIRLPGWLSLVLALALLALWTPIVSGDTATDEQTATGTVKSVSAKDNQFVLNIKGQTLTLRLADGAKIRVGDKDAEIGNLKEGDQVTATYRMQARAVRSVDGTHAYGEIKSISADRDKFVLKDQAGKEFTFQINKDAKVRLGDKEGKIDDLKTGETVVVGYAKEGDQLMARHIRCRQAGQATHLTHGELKSIAAAKNQFTLKDSRGNERTFNLAKDAKVRVGDREGKLADLKEGDQVNVAYQAMATDVRAKNRE
jgi:uncharacterized protein YrzB (UPF0473 family)